MAPDNSEGQAAPVFRANDNTGSGQVEGGAFKAEGDVAGSMEFPSGYKPPKPEPKEGEEGYVAPQPEGEPEKVTEGEEADAGKKETAEDELADLGEWNKDDAAVQEKFDARYFKEGKLNEAALSKEFFSSKGQKDKDGKAIEPGLKESTYAYLADTLGISKEFAKQVEAGLEATNAQAERAFTDRVGGAERYNAALEWGRRNYTPAQRERFNAARSKGGEDFLETVDALMLRYEKANPQAAQPRRGPPQQQTQRRSTPERTGTGNGAPAGDRQGEFPNWPDHAAYSKDWAKALADQKAATTPQAKRDARAKIDRMRIAGRRRFSNS